MTNPSMPRSFTFSNKYPTLYQVLFSPYTPYVPPQASPIAMFAWKQRIWFESAFGLVVMEPWEKYTTVVFLLLVFGCMSHAGHVAYRMLSSIAFGFKSAAAFPHDATAIQNTTHPVS